MGVDGQELYPDYLPRQQLMADTKVIYRRYASLFFITSISPSDNELITLEIIHRYVEVLDRYFGNVRRLCFSADSRSASSTSSSTSKRHMLSSTSLLLRANYKKAAKRQCLRPWRRATRSRRVSCC